MMISLCRSEREEVKGRGQRQQKGPMFVWTRFSHLHIAVVCYGKLRKQKNVRPSVPLSRLNNDRGPALSAQILSISFVASKSVLNASGVELGSVIVFEMHADFDETRLYIC